MPDGRQAARWPGHTLYDENGGKVGKIEAIFADEHTGQPAWATVSSGLFGRKHHFVPITHAREVEDGVAVPVAGDLIKAAPQADADEALSLEDERALYRHYGLDHGSALAAERRAADEPREQAAREREEREERERRERWEREQQEARHGDEDREDRRSRDHGDAQAIAGRPGDEERDPTLPRAAIPYDERPDREGHGLDRADGRDVGGDDERLPNPDLGDEPVPPATHRPGDDAPLPLGRHEAHDDLQAARPAPDALPERDATGAPDPAPFDHTTGATDHATPVPDARYVGRPTVDDDHRVRPDHVIDPTNAGDPAPAPGRDEDRGTHGGGGVGTRLRRLFGGDTPKEDDHHG